MAQIFVLGRVENNLEVKKSQKNSSYVCFYVKEQTGNGQTQSYQVWAWDTDVSRLIRMGVKKGSLVWLTGTLQMVDSTEDHGKIRPKLLKVYLTNWGYVPLWHSRQNHTTASSDSEILPDMSISSAEVLDGDRESLPE